MLIKVIKRSVMLLSVTLLLTACDNDGGKKITGPLADPLFADQWHLENTGQRGANGVPGTSGEDINVTAAWDICFDEITETFSNTCRGEGVNVLVVDDGLEIAHEDLAANIAAGLSFDYVDSDTDPTPASAVDMHGTGVAGLIGARDYNDLGVHGVAPRSNLIGYNMLQVPTAVNEADSMSRNIANIAVVSNSWGPPDDTGDIEPTPALWATAVETGVTTGRGGLGAVYVWAGGNGHPFDNSNYDGIANYRRVIAVGAVDSDGKKASYSERGANITISAPGGEACEIQGITTVDRTGDAGLNLTGITDDFADRNYTRCFGGTSASTPIVSGAVALILQTNPALGFRDVRAILARSARQNDALHPGWRSNGAGLHINHDYGFGVLDVSAAVTMARTWTNLGPEQIHATALDVVNLPVPDNDFVNGVSSTIAVSGSNVSNIEFIEITFSAADHTAPENLSVILTNETTGTSSVLSETHLCTSSPCTAHNAWVFGSVRHLGESADGNWTLLVKDQQSGGTGTFQSWGLTFYGS